MNGMRYCPAMILMLVVIDAARGDGTAAIPPAVSESWSMMIGEWKVAGHVGTKAVNGSASFVWAADKHCYIGQQQWQVGGEGHTVYLALVGGWDAATNETVEQGFSSSGDAATVRYSAAVVSQEDNVVTGKVEGTTAPDRHWSGSVVRKWNGMNEFVLMSTVKGDVVHALKYTRIIGSTRGDRGSSGSTN
jgi:hypothetical protein